MKKFKLFTTVVLICIFAYTAKAQMLPYRPFSEFNNDIEGYLKYNFDERGNLYQGKTFAELMKDVEIKPLGYEVTSARSKTDNKSYILQIDVYFNHKIAYEYHPTMDAFLTIFWEIPYLSILEKDLEKQYPSDVWVSQHYDFFKDKKIKFVKFRLL